MKYLFDCLKKIYPDINPEDVIIETENGQDKIFFWNYPKPQPSQEDLEKVYYEVLQEVKSDEIKIIGNEKIKDLAKNTYQSEIDTYPIQESEAKTYLKDKNPDEVLFISTLAKIRGLSLDELVQRILKRAKMYKLAVATILGIQQKNLDIIWSGKLTEEELENYTWQDFSDENTN
jgi:hypothetical protein